MRKGCMRKSKLIALCLAGAVCAQLLAGCGKEGEEGTKVVFTTGLAEDEVFRIGNEVCKKAELMVYLATMQNQYESVYGEEIWDAQYQGVTLEDNIKDTVLARIAQIKTMYLMADKRGITLTDEEKGQVNRAAESYYNGLNETERELMGVSKELVAALYEEYALAEKVYETIIQDINPEINDDEARIITVQHILLRTTKTDESGSKCAMSESEKAEQKEKAYDVRAEVLRGEKDFEELAVQYSEDSTITYSFGKGQMDKAFEDAAYQLAGGEISPVIESEAGYHIIKCVNTFDRAQTDANKLKIVEERRKAIFGQEYDSFVASLKKQLNEKLVDSITLIRDKKVNADNFFDLYEELVEIAPAKKDVE